MVSLTSLRCIDLGHRDEIDRLNALRLTFVLAELSPRQFPDSLARSLLSIADDVSSIRDHACRTCIAILSLLG